MSKIRELRTTEKLIITVAVTGAFHGKEACPGLPEQPDEIARAAYDCWNEGASIVHIHPRDKDGKRSGDADIFRDIDQRIRDTKSDIIIQHSSAMDFVPQLAEDKRLQSIEMNPEMASLGIFITRLVEFGPEDIVIKSKFSDIEHGARVMLERGIKPELEVMNPVLLDDCHKLIDMGLVAKPYLIQFVMGMRRTNRSYMAYTPKLLMHLVESLPPDSIFNVAGIAADELPATTLSILLGGHLRVGFEDNIYYRRGELAGSNAQMVARAVRIARELGCEIATPGEAREMLSMPQLDKRQVSHNLPTF
jgi:3-keto-5-aminohexanoate cleavage enzyme